MSESSSNTERIPKTAVELATVGIVDPWTVSSSKQRQSSSESRGKYRDAVLFILRGHLHTLPSTII